MKALASAAFSSIFCVTALFTTFSTATRCNRRTSFCCLILDKKVRANVTNRTNRFFHSCYSFSSWQKTMEILEIRTLRGPNYWSGYWKKLIIMRLDIGDYEDKPTDKLDNFYERLSAALL